MKYTTLCFLAEFPLQNRIYQRYGLDILEENGVKVKAYDFSPVLMPVLYERVTKDLMNYEEKGYVRCMSKEEIRTAIRSIPKDALILCVVNYRPDRRFIYREITRRNLDYFYMMISQDIVAPMRERAKAYFRQISWKRIKYSLSLRIPKGLFRFKPATFVLGCGTEENSIRQFYKEQMCTEKTQLIYAHTNDYDMCLRLKEEPRIISEKYCVYIDEYLPFHPDLIGSGIRINAEEYYRDLERFFEFIEESYKLKVIVAAHPKAEYGENGRFFKNRTIIKYQTGVLVRDAEFAIYHKSNSLSYLITYQKPIVFVTCDAIERDFISGAQIIRRIAAKLGKPVLNVSGSYTKEQVDEYFQISEQVYFDYIRKYICAEFDGKVEGKLLGEIILEQMEEEGI